MEMGIESSEPRLKTGRFEGMVTPKVAPWLRAVGAVAFFALGALYLWLGGRWWLGLALLLAPDLAFIGFAFGVRAGVAAYNAVHLPLVPAALLVIAVVIGSRLAVLLMLVWLAHIGMDWAAGYGLKRVRRP